MTERKIGHRPCPECGQNALIYELEPPKDSKEKRYYANCSNCSFARFMPHDYDPRRDPLFERNWYEEI